MKYDYLNGTDFRMIRSRYYRFNSDTELLGRFMKVRRKDSVLDIGCSSGALLLYAACRRPAALYGIDLFAEVIEEAAENLKNNHVSAELSVSRVQDFKGGPFDVIVCNPPYFRTGPEELKSRDQYARAARHEEYLTPDELFKSVKRLLKDNGSFCLVHRASRLTELILTAELYGMRPDRMRICYKTTGGDAGAVLLSFRFSKTVQLKTEPPVYLDDRNTFPEINGGIQ